MKNKSAKQIIGGYRIKFCALVALYMLAFALFFWIISINAFIGIAGVVVLAVSIRAPFEKILESDIESVIYENLDPILFNEIVESGKITNQVRHRVLAAMSVGDHEKVLDIVEKSDKKTVNPLEKCNNLYRKGYVYFEQENYEKLAEVVRDFKSLRTQFAKYSGVFDTYTVFEKFDAMLDEDYEYVVDACEYDLDRISSKHQNHKITRINVSFYRAVALYKLGRLDDAKKGFEEIIAFAPKMHRATLAKKYIEKIQS